MISGNICTADSVNFPVTEPPQAARQFRSKKAKNNILPYIREGTEGKCRQKTVFCTGVACVIIGKKIQIDNAKGIADQKSSQRDEKNANI